MTAQSTATRTVLRRPLEIRGPTAAVALVVLLLLVVSTLIGLLVWQAYRDAIRTAETRAENSAHIAAEHVRWLVHAGYQALRRIDDSLGEDLEGITPATVTVLDAAVASLPGQTPAWVLDAEGDTVLTNEAGFVQANVSDREYFRALRDGDEWHISPLLTTRHSNERVFVIGRRIERDEEFLGAAIVAVPATVMSDFWRTLDLGPDSSVGLIREDGWLVDRHPVPDEPINLREHPLFAEHLVRAPTGFYHSERSPADDVARIVGYHRVADFPLVAVVGISRDAVTERFLSRIGTGAIIAVPFGLALLFVTYWVTVLLRRDERTRLELSQLAEQNRMLFREIHHRVKNNLQAVLALVQMHDVPTNAKEAIGRRIAAMTAVHEHIYGSDEFASLNLGEYIRKLTDGLSESYDSSVTVECRLEDIEVDADRALPLGLIVNEVVSNAFKHAFPDGGTGKITIALGAEDGLARLRIEDNGVGFDPDSHRTGMGSRLIKGLSRQIGADHEFRSDGGTVFELSFPLAGPAGTRPA